MCVPETMNHKKAEILIVSSFFCHTIQLVQIFVEDRVEPPFFLYHFTIEMPTDFADEKIIAEEMIMRKRMDKTHNWITRRSRITPCYIKEIIDSHALRGISGVFHAPI